MSQPNEINFGPVFMRGRKPAPVTSKPNPISNASGPTQTLSSQARKPTSGPTNANIKSNQNPPSTAPSPANNITSLPLPKSFSAAVSPGKELENRLQSNGIQNAWDTDLSHSSDPSSPRISPAADYSRETLLNLYSEHLATKLPPDLEINDPAISLEFIGPPLALIEMTDAEKELFAGPFNSEKRPQVNKGAAHHSTQDHSLGLTLSPETVLNQGLPNNKLSVGGPVKLGKHGTTDRFNSLGIQGGVLAGVASPTHPNPRRRGDNEPDPPEVQRRFQRPEDASPNVGPWSANRRARDSASSGDGKWKRGVSFEEKIQSQDSSSGSNLKYSVLDKMREKAASNLEGVPKEVHQSPAPMTQNDYDSKAGDQIPSHDGDHSATQPRGSREMLAAAPRIDENGTPSSLSNHEPSSSADPPNSIEPTRGSISQNGTESSATKPSPNDLNPEDIAWQYRDPSGTVQGPFTAFQMQEWYKATFFRDDLLVKRVIDGAFETLETLILRVGDRDRPFLARPPPILPPNLPLPHGHYHNHQLHTSQPSSQLPSPSLLDQASTNVPLTDAPPVPGSSLNVHSTSTSNQLGAIPPLDPWNNPGPRSSPSTRPGTHLASKPLVSGTGWNSSLPAFAHPNPSQNNDFEIKDGLVEFNPNLLNNAIMSNLNNSFVPPDPLRFLQQMQHPALSIAGGNGYPFPVPLTRPPNFGQIPSIPSLVDGSAMDPMLVAQLHSRLMHPSYLFNHPAASGVDVLEPQAGRSNHEHFASSANHLDPWQVPPQPPNDPSTSVSDQNHLQSALRTPNHNQPALPSNADHRGIPNPVASTDVIFETRPTGKFKSLESQDRGKSLMLDKKNASAHPEQSYVNSQLDVAGRTPAPATSSNLATTTEQDRSLHTAETSAAATHILTESNAQDKSISSSSHVASTQHASTPAIASHSDSNQPWQTVTYQPAAQPPNVTQTSVPPVPTPSLPKPMGKVVVLTRAQQDEQDRRTASIQKTQLQLKEAQAVERAAREASEAAAAAVTLSFSTPAPWPKEEKLSPSMPLIEIQAIEAKQAEKRRLADKQAAANRAMAERVMAAERASKAAKEPLPPTSNWAATASSPVKSSIPGTVWKPKESEGPQIANGQRKSMKEIQEEEARNKSLALQQAAKPAGSTVTKVAVGYAGTVASAKPPAGGPWSVVGSKSKVNAPLLSSNPTVASGNASVGPVTTRVGVATITAGKPSPKATIVTSKTTSKPLQTAPVSNTTIINSPSTTANNINADGPLPASPEFMKWLREALRGMNNVEDFVKMLLDFPINPDESVLEIVSDSVYAGSATLDGRRFAKEFNARRIADVASRTSKAGSSSTAKIGDASPPAVNGFSGTSGVNYQNRKSGNLSGFSSVTTMADAVKFQPNPKNDGWGFAVVGAKKKKK